MVNHEHFFGFYEARLEFIREHCADRLEGMLLLCSYIDSLSGYRYGGGSSFQRFRRWLIEETDQKHIWCKVSLVLLRQFMEEKNHEHYAKIIGLLNRLGAASANFVNLKHNPDITLDILAAKCRQEAGEEVASQLREDISRFEYAAILWHAYRNASVHETAVRLNQALNLANCTEPFYSNCNTVEDYKIISTRTCFDFPQQFLIATIESGLQRLRQHLSDGKFALTLSSLYDQPATNRVRRRRAQDKSDVQYPRMVTKPLRSFQGDLDCLVREAKWSHDAFLKTHSGEDRSREGTMSRCAIVASVFFIEALVNNVIEDFAEVDPYQLPESIRRRTGLTEVEFDRLPLKERLVLVPYLCQKAGHWPTSGFFDRGSKDFQLLGELIDIRGQFAHSRSVRRRMEISMTKARDFEIDDDFVENRWPLSGLPKDIFIVDSNHASQAMSIVRWVIAQLDQFLDGKLSADEWMSKERIEFAPRQ